MPLKFTGFAPGASPPAGTCQARPVRKTSSSPEIGTVVFHVLVEESKVVEVHVALGENVILAFGTVREYDVPPAVKEMFPLVRSIVAPLLGTLLALKWALNQI